MRFLFVGAGAIGGYFGGRLVQKGEDVTFLVRSTKQKQLEDEGLAIKVCMVTFRLPFGRLHTGRRQSLLTVLLLQ